MLWIVDEMEANMKLTLIIAIMTTTFIHKTFAAKYDIYYSCRGLDQSGENGVRVEPSEVENKKIGTVNGQNVFLSIYPSGLDQILQLTVGSKTDFIGSRGTNTVNLDVVSSKESSSYGINCDYIKTSAGE